jgi:hypothetical protein
MITFDAAGRETCIVRETRTNTPLQALTLMNETAFVEAARVLAQKALQQPTATVPERLTWAFRRVLGRPPRSAELTVLEAALQRNRERFRDQKDGALQLLAVGEAPRDETLDPVDHAAWTTVCALLLNLDETITRE